VNCYASEAAQAADTNNPIRGGLPLGSTCEPGEYAWTYTCGGAFDGYFSQLSAFGDSCRPYIEGCCGKELPPLPDKCKQCHRKSDDSRPLGVNCYASEAAQAADTNNPIRGGLPLGSTCEPGEYAWTYTCGESFDAYYSHAFGDLCRPYTEGCCGGSGSYASGSYSGLESSFEQNH